MSLGMTVIRCMVLVQARKTGNHPGMTEKLLTGTLSIKTKSDTYMYRTYSVVKTTELFKYFLLIPNLLTVSVCVMSITFRGVH